MVPWSFLSISLNECAVSIINNEGLIRKIYLPKLVFPLVRVLIALVTFVLSLARLVPAAVAAGCPAVVGAAVSAGGDRAAGDVHAGAGVDRGHAQHVLSRLRPSDRRGSCRPGTSRRRSFFRSSSSETRSGGCGSIRRFISSRSFTTSCTAGQWPRIGLVATAAVIAAMSMGIGYAIFKSQEDKMVFRL